MLLNNFSFVSLKADILFDSTTQLSNIANMIVQFSGLRRERPVQSGLTRFDHNPWNENAAEPGFKHTTLKLLRQGRCIEFASQKSEREYKDQRDWR